MIGWQVQDHRCPLQLLRPIVELSLEHLSRQPLTLPVRKIGILNGEFWQRGGLVKQKGFVKNAQLSNQDAH